MTEFGLFAEMIVLGFFGFGFWSIFKGLIKRQQERIVHLDGELKARDEKMDRLETSQHKSDIAAVELRSQIDSLIAAADTIQLRQSLEIGRLKAENKRLKAEWMELLESEVEVLTSESKQTDEMDSTDSHT